MHVRIEFTGARVISIHCHLETGAAPVLFTRLRMEIARHAVISIQ